jgi:hypothetical protein
VCVTGCQTQIGYPNCVRAGADASFPTDLAQQVQGCNNLNTLSKACQDAALRVLAVLGCNDVCVADLNGSNARQQACAAATIDQCATTAAPCDGSAGSPGSTGTGDAPAAAGTTQDSATTADGPAAAKETSSTRSLASAGAVAVVAAVASMAAVASGLLV